MDFKELKDFIKAVSKSGVSEVNIKTADLKLDIKVKPFNNQKGTHTETVIQQIPMHTAVQPMMQMPGMPQNMVTQAGSNETKTEKKEESDDSKYITIKAPMVGTFYRKPSPDKPTFVNVGDSVNSDTVVCIIEAMKLFNEIEAEVSGKVVKVLVDDASPIEFDQPLFLIDPS
jgi:acetyl-CoA carboxylase biotin carboxyl carrier protein